MKPRARTRLDFCKKQTLNRRGRGERSAEGAEKIRTADRKFSGFEFGIGGDSGKNANQRKGAGGRQKIGAESSDPNRHSQPRLPGSVVGEASMRPLRKSRKITEVTARKLRSGKLHLTPIQLVLAARSCYFVVTSECVIAWTDNAMRFCTPTLRISLATWAFTVRSSIPS